MANDSSHELIGRNPPEVFHGRPVFEKLGALYTEAEEKQRTDGEDITSRSVSSAIFSIENYYDKRRILGVTDDFLSLVIEESDGSNKVSFKGADLTSVSDEEDQEDRYIDLSTEEEDKLMADFSLALTPNNITVIAGNPNLNNNQVERLGNLVEKTDEEIARRLGVRTSKKAVLLDTIGLENLDTHADLTERFVSVGNEGLEDPDNPTDDDFIDQLRWGLARFYFGEYENIFNQDRNIKPLWRNIERHVNFIKKNGPENFAPMPEIILQRESESLKDNIYELLLGTGRDINRPEAKLMRAIFGQEAEDAFAALKDSGYDLRKVPKLAEYKKYADWITAYDAGFVDFVQGALSKDNFNKEELTKNEHLGIDLNEAYQKIVDSSFDSGYAPLDPSNILRHVMSAFMYHLTDEYGISYFDLAKATSMMSEENYDINYFCEILGVDYQDAIKTWK